MASEREAMRSLFDEFFGEQKLETPTGPERTPVDLPQDQALRMRCIEIVLEQWEPEKKLDWFEVKRSANKLATFVKNGF